MDPYSKYHFYLALVSMVISLAAIVHSLWSNRQKAVRAWFDGHDKRLKELEKKVEATPSITRVEELEKKVGNMPNHCTGHSALSGKQENQAESLAQHKLLLTAVESDLKHLPTVRDIEKLYARMDEFRTQVSNLQSEVSKIAGAMPGIVHVTDMMNEFLLNHGGK